VEKLNSTLIAQDFTFYQTIDYVFVNQTKLAEDLTWSTPSNPDPKTFGLHNYVNGVTELLSVLVFKIHSP
ncbi:Hypothetical predicted protein, partial [Pelobates cultripes]